MSGGLAPNLNIVTTTISGSGGSQTTVVVSYSINNSGRTVATTTLTTLAVQGTHGLSGGGATAGSTSTAAPSTPSTTTPTSTLASPIPSAPASSVNTQSTGPTSESAATSSNGATSAQESSTSAASATTNNRYTGGALAGAIVGSILGAAILTFLVTFLFFRKRFQRTPAQESRNGRSRRPSGKGLMAGDEKAALAGGAAAGVGMGWAAFLPQSADDKTIQHSVKTLYEQIELHVDNYYHKASVGLDEHTREALSKVDTGKLPGSITDLMSTQSSQLSVIKHCIADLLITRMTPGRDPSSSLLPASLSVYPSKLSQPPSHSRESAGKQARLHPKRAHTLTIPPTHPQPPTKPTANTNPSPPSSSPPPPPNPKTVLTRPTKSPTSSTTPSPPGAPPNPTPPPCNSTKRHLSTRPRAQALWWRRSLRVMLSAGRLLGRGRVGEQGRWSCCQGCGRRGMRREGHWGRVSWWFRRAW